MAVFTGNGSAASPSITFSSDTDTGIFRPGADSISFTIGGAETVNVAGTVFRLGSPHLLAGSAGGSFNIIPGYAGSGTDLAGGNLALFAGRGTGSAEASLQFYTWQRQSSGTTTQFAQLAGSFVQTGVLGGNYFRLSSASGGIQFGGSTGAGDALNDYEQGTFVPSVKVDDQSGAVIALNSNFNSFRYVKVGRAVFIQGRLTSDGSPGAGTNISISLPFPPVALVSGSNYTATAVNSSWAGFLAASIANHTDLRITVDPFQFTSLRALNFNFWYYTNS
jgi:hypothetical protein